MATAPALKGVVTYSDHAYRIAGVTLSTRLSREFSELPGLTLREPIPLGKAVSNTVGEFVIYPEAENAAETFACFASCLGVQIQVQDTDGSIITTFDDIKLNLESELELSLPIFDTRHDLPLKDLAYCMQEFRIVNMSTLVEELTTLAPSGVFSEWTVAKRILVLEALENSFLDPTGQLEEHGLRLQMSKLNDPESLEQLYHVVMHHDNQELTQAFEQAIRLTRLAGGHLKFAEVPVDPLPVQDGDLRRGVHQFVGDAINDNFSTWHRDYYDRFPWSKDPLAGYRNYLVNIWKKWAAQQQAGQSLNEAGAVKQLENRFHQKFTTTDQKEVPVNKLLINLLQKILEAPTGSGFGFGVNPGTIKSQDEETDRAYLDYLIDLTGETKDELEKRYRTNLSMSDLETSNPVQLNIDTIQRFFTDSFQSVADHYNILPPLAGNGYPILKDAPKGNQQHGPFFWQYEEWLERESPFYGENYLDLRTYFYCSLQSADRKDLFDRTEPLDKFYQDATVASKYRPVASPGSNDLSRQIKIGDQWARNLLELQDRLNAAHRDYFAGFYSEAEKKYGALILIVFKLKIIIDWWSRSDMGHYNAAKTASWQKKYATKDPESLKSFEEKYHLYFDTTLSSIGPGASMGNSWASKPEQLAKVPYLIALLLYRLIPYCLAESRIAQGKYKEAIQGGAILLYTDSLHHKTFEKGLAEVTQFNVYTGPTPVEPGSKISPDLKIWWPVSNNTGSLLFATGTAMKEYGRGMTEDSYFPANKTEHAFFKLQLGNAMLEWADVLYRTDQPDSKARARELYKGVLYLHGQDPEITPKWNEFKLGELPTGFFSFKRNPALSVQIERARIGFDQLNGGLNYYGFPPVYVPPVRYRVLKEAAEKFAASAKSAQNDYLTYMQKYEQAVLDQMTAQNMVEKASYAIQIASEQIELSRFSVGEAQKQVENIKGQIAAKRKEIKDAESFFEQAKSFFSGIKDAAEGLGKSFLGEMETGAAAGGGGSMDWKAMYKVVSSKGSTSAASAGLTGGMAIMAGYGAFVYAGYTSMSSMEEAASKRAGALNALEKSALPAAQKMVELKKREQNIASLQKSIAEADYQFGKKLLDFYDYRFLSKAFWQQLSSFSNRLMRRYTDMGGRTAWFAERALSFEINKDVRVVSFDYFPKTLRGVTGADSLQLHLAELEANRIYSLSQTIPVKNTWSLARNFPIALGQLKKNGICRFDTSEELFKSTYPGVYGYRIRCVSIGLTYADEVMPHRGMLFNNGFSRVSNSSGLVNHLLRYPDGLPLSEFNIRGDMLVYELPDETLLPFEGSGIDTTWELSLSRTGMATTLEEVTDVLITLDMRASYSASLKAKHEINLPVKWKKGLLISGKEMDKNKIHKFKKDGGLLSLHFDPALAAGNVLEKKKTINLVGIMLSGVNSQPVKARLKAIQDNETVNFIFDHGVAMSNSGFLNAANGGVPMPLNKITGLTANQDLIFELDEADNAGIDFSGMEDVQLFLEYEAEI